MSSGREKDFLMLFLHGDVIVLPVEHFDALLGRFLDDATTEDFMGAKGFLLDETAMPSLPLPLIDSRRDVSDGVSESARG